MPESAVSESVPSTRTRERSAPSGDGPSTSASTVTSASTETTSDPPDGPSPTAEETHRLRRAFAEIAQLVGGLAHEIRNPLSTMALNLELLAEDLRDAEEPRERRIAQKIERVRAESRRLEQILEDFLRFARVPELRDGCPCDLNGVIQDLADFYEPQAAGLGIIVRTHLDPNLPPVVLDADLFKQSILNLILNAQHAMPDGGELILTTRSEGAAVVLDVVDTGCGIPDPIRPRIFDAFYSTRPGGTGLGLATTRRIIEAHRGSIEVQSEPGKGSRFSVRLPRAGVVETMGGHQPG